MVHHELTNLEAVALAVRSEIDSTDLYGKLASRVKNPDVRQLLEDLAADEEKHRKGLMNLYLEMLGDQEPSIPEQDGRDKKIDLDPEADYLAVMTAARDKEQESEAFYSKAATTVLDFKTRSFFLELADSERRHAAMLQRMVEKLKEDPHWFDRVDADPFKGTHLGP
jgi:rubrerythrin